jgi:uncharacterized protein (TIGR02466 family)
MEIIRHNLFATPISYYKGFLPRGLAIAIKEYILRKHIQSSPHRSITGNALSIHTELSNFIEDVVADVKGCNELKANIEKCIDNYVQETGRQACEINNSWFNIQNPGSILHRHNHMGGSTVLSGALYISIEKDSAPLVFENPNPYSLLTEHFSKYDYSQYTFKPAIGDLIIFPPWLIHSSVEPNTTLNRIVISFNASA